MPKDRQFHSGCDQLRSVSLLVRCDAVTPGNWLSTFRIIIENKTSLSEIFLIMLTVNMRSIGGSETSSADYQVTRRRKA